MNFTINPNFQFLENDLKKILEDFKKEGTLIGSDKRNVIKFFPLKDLVINVKSFKTPAFINKIVYQYFRKSKARRSFEYANRLLENGVGTPQPIAYFEEYSLLGLEKSFYISEQMQCDLTYRELVLNPDYPDYENILRQFTQFSFELHEKGIEFLDHSPGNTLIKNLGNGRYAFALVDLNRMNFDQKLSFERRMKNLSRLTHREDMVAVMSDEYAKLYHQPYEKVFGKMNALTFKFQKKYHRKIELKKKLKLK